MTNKSEVLKRFSVEEIENLFAKIGYGITIDNLRFVKRPITRIDGRLNCSRNYCEIKQGILRYDRLPEGSKYPVDKIRVEIDLGGYLVIYNN